MAAEISLTSPIQPTKLFSFSTSNMCSISSAENPIVPKMGVLTIPGLIAFTRSYDSRPNPMHNIG